MLQATASGGGGGGGGDIQTEGALLALRLLSGDWDAMVHMSRGWWAIDDNTRTMDDWGGVYPAPGDGAHGA